MPGDNLLALLTGGVTGFASAVNKFQSVQNQKSILAQKSFYDRAYLDREEALRTKRNKEQYELENTIDVPSTLATPLGLDSGPTNKTVLTEAGKLRRTKLSSSVRGKSKDEIAKMGRSQLIDWKKTLQSDMSRLDVRSKNYFDVPAEDYDLIRAQLEFVDQRLGKQFGVPSKVAPQTKPKSGLDRFSEEFDKQFGGE